ncbi:hypothetical protein GCM10018785_45220 [Streptomyces longispororuber]|uniref:Uncharacterized protein n=1 Tax=Streptomyces longispororuber TaxID=68230 RepID=A0A918ZV25_9ACTN|nr:hypothetical protein [Streptomyces longispororuber]GHE71918.1 hypothetical protein GCM10018785_45220 [Streptomyces longispororuber]
MTHSRVRSCREIGKTVIAHVEGNDELRSWLSERCTAWKIEEGGFKRRLSALFLAVAYALTPGEPTEVSPDLSLLSMLEALEKRTVADLFAPITSDADYEAAYDVKEVWIISTGATPVRALYWSRLRYAAAGLLTLMTAEGLRKRTVQDLAES